MAGGPHLTITDRGAPFLAFVARRQSVVSRRSSVVSNFKFLNHRGHDGSQRNCGFLVASLLGMTIRWGLGRPGVAAPLLAKNARNGAPGMTGLVVVSRQSSVVSNIKFLNHRGHEGSQRNCGFLVALLLGMTTFWGREGAAGVAGRVGVLRLRSATPRCAQHDRASRRYSSVVSKQKNPAPKSGVGVTES